MSTAPLIGQTTTPPAGDLVGPMTDAGRTLLADIQNLVVDNLGWFLAVFTFWLAVRFGPSLLSWFRHRNDPKQLSES